ncbi:MAG: AtpZ/AtpI family protein [FCB group bacterium]|nr:AtpZ/AtpI family protein [FCB group bacterium]
MTDEENFLASSFRYLQKMIRQSGPAASASYTMIGAIILLGGLGYLIDRWYNTEPWFLLGGLLLGIIVGLYEIAKVVWKNPR